eukprot:528483-Hanusia_phi.AAC.2
MIPTNTFCSQVLVLVLAAQVCHGAVSTLLCRMQQSHKTLPRLSAVATNFGSSATMKLRGGVDRQLDSFEANLLESDLRLAETPQDVMTVLKRHRNETFESVTRKYTLEKLLATIAEIEHEDCAQWYSTVRNVLRRVKSVLHEWEKPQGIRRILMNLSHIMKMLSGNECFREDCLDILHMQEAMSQRLLGNDRNFDGECLADVVSALVR